VRTGFGKIEKGGEAAVARAAPLGEKGQQEGSRPNKKQKGKQKKVLVRRGTGENVPHFSPPKETVHALFRVIILDTELKARGATASGTNWRRNVSRTTV